MISVLAGMQLNMVLEPGGLSNQLVTGTSSGELKFVDFRVVDGSGQMGVWKTVEAHTKGAMSTMAAHPYSPLLATATATQVHACQIALSHRMFDNLLYVTNAAYSA